MGNIVAYNPCANCEKKMCSMCELNMYREGSLANNKWISVDERLPDEDGEYLTWDGLVYFLIWFNASLGLWNVSESGDTSSAIRDVTHWMPLPEAPKMKGGAE